MLTVALACNANATEFTRPIVTTIPVHNQNMAIAQEQQTKPVYLMNIKLTPAQKNKFIQFDPTNKITLNAASGSEPKRVQLGMNNVPVLDQGQHGTCVTFAMTAAVDALLGKGDYVSQLCSLELGSYLEKRSYVPSGWDGSYGELVLNQLLEFGIVNTKTQKTKSCSGMTAYPRDEETNVGNPMTLDEYKQDSEDLNDHIVHVAMLSDTQRMIWSEKESDAKMDNVLSEVKKSLATKDDNISVRVVFGTLLPYRHCSAGACAKFKEKNDTWALTSEINSDKNPEFGGHEMVITGYDDQSIAQDKDGTKHTGLFTLRNSWGEDAGDKGNFYMTYDFFKKYALEANAVEYVKNLQD